MMTDTFLCQHRANEAMPSLYAIRSTPFSFSDNRSWNLLCHGEPKQLNNTSVPITVTGIGTDKMLAVRRRGGEELAFRL